MDSLYALLGVGMNEDFALALEEYRLCHTSASSLETSIWQTFAAVGVVSVSAFSYTLFAPDTSWQQVVSIGTVVSVLSLIWLLMADRWWSLQQTHFLRMYHIEQKLTTPRHQVLTQTYIRRRNAVRMGNRSAYSSIKTQIGESQAKEIDDVSRYRNHGARMAGRLLVAVFYVAWLSLSIGRWISAVVSSPSPFWYTVKENSIAAHVLMSVYAIAGVIALIVAYSRLAKPRLLTAVNRLRGC